MKHLLNDLTEKEKNSIREQHTGGMNVVTENFSKLINTKSGDVKPLVNEQEGNKFLEDNYIPNITKEGYKQVNKISLPDGEYKKQGSGYRVDLYDKDGKTFTGYIIITNSGIRGAWNNEPINVANGTIEDVYKMFFKDLGYKPTQQPQGQGDQEDVKTIINKVATEGIKNVTSQMISSPQFKGNYSGYQFGGEFNGVNYQWDCNGVEGMSGVRGMIEGEIITETLENMLNSIKKPNTDGKPGTPCVGFYGGTNSKFIIYTTTSNKPKCLYF